MPRTSSGWRTGSEAKRLLESEAARVHSAVQNTFASSARAARLRAARQLLTATGVAAGVTWGVGWLATSDAALDLGSAPADVLRLVASASLLFVFVLDGAGRSVWSRSRWEARFADQWLQTCGVHPAAVALRHAVLLTLRALLFSWLPLLPIHGALLRFSAGSRLVLLMAGPACGLTGDAIGVLSRRGPRWVGPAFAAAGVVYWGALLTYWGALLTRLFGGHPWSELTLIPARTLFLSDWNVAATALAFTLAAIANVLINWWGSERARARPGSLRAFRPPPRSRRGETRATRESIAHVRTALRRLSSWVRQEWIAAGVVGTLGLVPIVAITVRFSQRAEALTASQAALTLAWSLALPALVCSEVMWGTLPRDMWALYRINARSLHVPVVVPGAVTLGVLSLWVAVGVATLMIATPAGGRSAWPFAVAGLLLAVHCASLQTFAGALALRSGAHRASFGRALRYAGTAAGLLLPVLMVDAAGIWPAVAWVGLVALITPAGAAGQFSRCQFGHDLRTE